MAATTSADNQPKPRAPRTDPDHTMRQLVFPQDMYNEVKILNIQLQSKLGKTKVLDTLLMVVQAGVDSLTANLETAVKVRVSQETTQRRVSFPLSLYGKIKALNIALETTKIGKQNLPDTVLTVMRAGLDAFAANPNLVVEVP